MIYFSVHCTHTSLKDLQISQHLTDGLFIIFLYSSQENKAKIITHVAVFAGKYQASNQISGLPQQFKIILKSFVY